MLYLRQNKTPTIHTRRKQEEIYFIGSLIRALFVCVCCVCSKLNVGQTM